MTVLLRIFFLLIIFLADAAKADEWIHHIPFGGVDQMTETSGRIYFTSLGALFAFDKKNAETILFSPNDLTGDVGVTGIYSSPASSVVAVAYENGNINIIRDNGDFFNIPDIKISLLSHRAINHIVFAEDNKTMFIATDFGLVYYDLREMKVIGNLRFNNPVSHVAIVGSTTVIDAGGRLYALHPSRPFTSPGSWSVLAPIRIIDMLGSGDRLFLVHTSASDTVRAVCSIDPESMTLDRHSDYSATDIIALTPQSDGSVWFYSTTRAWHYSTGGQIITSAPLPSQLHGSILSAAGGASALWSGNNKGIACFDISGSPSIKIDRLCPGYMSVANVNMLRLSPSGNLYIGSRGNSNVHINRSTGNLARICRRLPDGSFQDLTPVNLSSSGNTVSNPYGLLLDLTFIREDPANPSVHFVGSLSEGMYAINGMDEINHFYTHNTTFLDNWGVRVMDIVFDNFGGLWAYSEAPDNAPMVHYLPPEARSRLNNISSSDWTPVPFTSGIDSGRDCTAIISSSGRYIYSMGSADIYIYDTNATSTIDDDSGIWARSFSSPDGDISVGRVCSIMEDPADGSLWIGTDVGVLIAPEPWNILGDAISVFRPKVNRDDGSNLADYLLSTERIYGITLDPLGNKWIATHDSGAYLVTPDGTGIIAHFTAGNSPLPSNLVSAVACTADGTVFFGSSYGLIEYRSDIHPGAPDLTHVRIYPNPVRPDHLGDVFIEGLMDQSIVKILNSGGSLVATLRSDGGTIRWNPSSRNLPSGVYHIIASSPSSSDHPVGRLVIIR